MLDNDNLIKQLDKSGHDVFWQGKASVRSIERLEAALQVRLPESFRQFLLRYGGGGVVGEEISGIEDDDPTLEFRGTILGDTLRCRSDYNLPTNLIVIYLGDDDTVWCLDTSSFSADECRVVSFDVFTRGTQQLARDFGEFLIQYLTLRISRAGEGEKWASE